MLNIEESKRDAHEDADVSTNPKNVTLVLSELNEFLNLLKVDSKFVYRSVPVKGMVASSKPLPMLWFFFIFAVNEEVRGSLVSNLCDIFMEMGVKINFDLNNQPAIEMLGKFITENYPLSDNRKIIIELNNNDPNSIEARKSIEKFKTQYIPTKQQNYFSVTMESESTCITFKSKAEIVLLTPHYPDEDATVTLGYYKGNVCVTPDMHYGVIDVICNESFYGSMYFSHYDIADKTVEELRSSVFKDALSRVDDRIIVPTYNLEFSEEYCNTMQPMKKGETVCSHASISALFKKAANGAETASLCRLNFNKFTVKEEHTLNPVKGLPELECRNEPALRYPTLHDFDYQKGEKLHVKLVSGINNDIFDLVLNVDELHKIPITEHEICDSRGKKHTYFIRKKHDIGVRKIDSCCNIGCDTAGDLQPSTALAGTCASSVGCEVRI